MTSLPKSAVVVPLVAVSIASMAACSSGEKQESPATTTASASAIETPSTSPSQDTKAQEQKRAQEQHAQESRAAASKQAEQDRLAAEKKAKVKAAAEQQAAEKAAAQKRAAEQAAREKQADREAALRDPWIGGQWTYAYEQGTLDADDRAWVEANGLAPGGVNTPEYQEAHEPPLMDDDGVPTGLSDEEMAEWERQWRAENPAHN
ncbi:MAG: hypothetical protein ACTIJJ_10700 [Galactobacter sp.]